MKVLVIEDTPANLALARVVLEHDGHVVITAESAGEGIALARSARPDLILLDIQLPGVDGFAATRALKSSTVTRDIPVIALTAHAMKGDRERIAAAGCDGYLAKPFHYPELLELVRQYARRT